MEINPTKIYEYLVLYNIYVNKKVSINLLIKTLSIIFIYFILNLLFYYLPRKNNKYYNFFISPYFLFSMISGYYIILKYSNILILKEYPDVNYLIKIFIPCFFILLYIFNLSKIKHQVLTKKLHLETNKYTKLPKKFIFFNIFVTFIISLIYTWTSLITYIELGIFIFI